MRIHLKIPLTVKEIAAAINSPLHYPQNTVIDTITTSSKEVCRGDLFVALKGENFDGKDFIPEALERGAYVMSDLYDNYNLTVPNTETALLKIAKFYKSKLKDLKKTVAITGSVGKTTTKNILSKILSSSYKVHATNENFNNLLGVCITVLSAPADTEILVVEMGMNHIGEISELSRAVMPNLAIITNIGNAHVGNLGSREMIARAKLEISDGMSDAKNIIIPYGEPLLSHVGTSYTASIKSPEAFSYLKITDKTHLGTKFDAYVEKKKLFEASVGIPGEHIAIAVCFSVAVATILGMSEDVIRNSIVNLPSLCSRGRFIDCGGYKIYDDTYSSSPEAVISDFELLALYPARERSCVIGDMLELGTSTERLHRKIGAAVHKYGFRHLFAFGSYAPFVIAGALEAGMSPEKISINTDTTSPELTARQIREHANHEEIILVKASHSLHAERIYDFLK